MLNSTVFLVENFIEINEQQQKLMDLNNEMMNEILDLYQTVDMLDICIDFPYTKTKFISGKQYIFEFNQEGILNSVKIDE